MRSGARRAGRTRLGWRPGVAPPRSFDAAERLGNRGETLYWRGKALLTLERWAEAHDAFVASAEAGWRHARWSWGGAGYALSRAGQHAEALAAWDRALAMDDAHFNAMSREFGMVDGEKAAWKRSRRAVGRE